MARAFRVFRGQDEVGYLGEGRGPFISAVESALGHPVLEHARFTSLDMLAEDAIAAVLVDHRDFETDLSLLKASGFELRPATYEELFMPVEQAGRGPRPDAVASGATLGGAR